MAFFDHNIPNKKMEDLKLSAIGEAYDVWELVKMPPVRSGNLIIHEMHVEGLAFNAANANLWHCNIEIRKKGVDIHFRNGDGHFSWVVPFYRLSMFHSEHLTIHSNGFFVRLKNGYTLKSNFFQLLISKKNEALNRHKP